jgi:glycosyltransferase involved in cell wall biosynthesis
LRLLIATPHRNVVAGVERYLQVTIPALAIRGHEISLLCENRFDVNLEAIDPAELHLASCSVAEAGVDAAVRFAADWKPDLIYSHGLESTALQSALMNAHPSVLYAHNYFGTCATGQKCHAFPAPRPCTRQFGLGCLVLHYPRRCGGLHPGTMWKMFQQAAEMNRQLHRFEAVLVASRHMGREFQRHGVAPDKIHVLPLPNPYGATQAPARAAVPSGGRILFLGRLTKLKGVGHLLRAIPVAARKLGRPLSVTVAGDGPVRAQLESLAGKLGVSAEFLGWIDGQRKSVLLEEVDLLAVPSLWPEPFGLVGIEAGAHGLPAVAYDVGGIPDWLIQGESGELARGDPPSPEGLADAIVRALSDPAHYARLCIGARREARRFGLETHLNSLERIFDGVRNKAAEFLVPARHGIEV